MGILFAHFQFDHFQKSKCDSKSPYFKKSKNGYPIVFLKLDLTDGVCYFHIRRLKFDRMVYIYALKSPSAGVRSAVCKITHL